MSWSSLGTTRNTWNGYLPETDEYPPLLSSNPEVLKTRSESNEDLKKNSTERDKDIHSMCFVQLNPLAPCFIPSRPVPNVNFDQVFTTGAPDDLDLTTIRALGFISDPEESAASVANSAPLGNIEVEISVESGSKNVDNTTSHPILNPLAACFIAQVTKPSCLNCLLYTSPSPRDS